MYWSFETIYLTYLLLTSLYWPLRDDIVKKQAMKWSQKAFRDHFISKLQMNWSLKRFSDDFYGDLQIN